jgi:hypothetical protein
VFPILSAVKSTGAGAVLVLAVVLTAAFAATAHSTVGIAGAPVRSRWFVLLALAVLCTVPLTERFGAIELSLARPRRCFAIRLATAAVPLGLGVGSCLLLVPGDDALRGWFVLLVAVSIAVCAFAPDAGWFVCLGVGGLTIMVDHLSRTVPVTNVVTQVGGNGVVVVLILAVALFLGASGLARPRLERTRG